MASGPPDIGPPPGDLNRANRRWAVPAAPPFRPIHSASGTQARRKRTRSRGRRRPSQPAGDRGAADQRASQRGACEGAEGCRRDAARCRVKLADTARSPGVTRGITNEAPGGHTDLREGVPTTPQHQRGCSDGTPAAPERAQAGRQLLHTLLLLGFARPRPRRHELRCRRRQTGNKRTHSPPPAPAEALKKPRHGHRIDDRSTGEIVVAEQGRRHDSAQRSSGPAGAGRAETAARRRPRDRCPVRAAGRPSLPAGVG